MNLIPGLIHLWSEVTWIQKCVRFNHRKKMKAETSWLISRKSAENLEFLFIQNDDNLSNTEKKMEDFSAIFEPSTNWIQEPFTAGIKDNEQLNLQEQHLKLQLIRFDCSHLSVTLPFFVCSRTKLKWRVETAVVLTFCFELPTRISDVAGIWELWGIVNLHTPTRLAESEVTYPTFPNFLTPIPDLIKSLEIMVHSTKSLFQQKFQTKLYHFNRNS